MPPDHRVMRNLNETANIRPFADHRVARRPALNRAIGADFNVVLNDHPANLRRLQTPFVAWTQAAGKLETGVTNARAGMKNDPIADKRVTDRDLRAD